MIVEALRIDGLRSLHGVEIALAPGVNVLAGPNGAGKTSVLEALFLLSHGRSFRSGARDALLARSATELSIFAQLQHADGRRQRIGLGRGSTGWEARIDGAGVALGTLVESCAVTCFEPGSHALISGAAEERRRFLDWGVFHVEHWFLDAWRRYQRALKQRNALLRSTPAERDGLYEPWERELGESAVLIDAARGAYLDALLPCLEAELARLLPELGPVTLAYRRGWKEDAALAEALATQRVRDAGRGHTTQGPHRADWTLGFAEAPQREHLSRGQEKLTALACVLAQGALFAQRLGEWPIVCLDDLGSELDQPHQQALVASLQAVAAQIVITGTEIPPALAGTPARVFHVEQGHLTTLL